jgi:RNA polymerase sigma factor (sigma-70 family)
MDAARPAELLRRLERADGHLADDADLLARFATTRDAAAFAELVRRHGGLVLGVCRRVTGHAQDAEDAFQATFLVLAQRAASLRHPALLGCWLYGVAYRVAWRAKRSARRRRAREVTVSVLPDVPDRPPTQVSAELGPILDEELAALPAHYRDALVLCDLRGTPRQEAAAALGIPEGTLSSRLANGRKRLAARLARRGVALSVAALPVGLAGVQGAVVVPNDLVTRTSRLVADWAAGGAVPGPVSRLAEGGFAVRKLMALGAVVCVAVTGAVLAARPREAPPVDPPKPVAARGPEADAPQPKPDPKRPEQQEVAYTSSPRLLGGLDVKIHNGHGFWSHDGTTLAVVGMDSPDVKTQEEASCLLRYPPKSNESDRIYCSGRVVGFSSDGKHAITALRENHLLSGFHQLAYWDLSKARLSIDDRRGGSNLAAEAKVRTVDFDGPGLEGYAFAADDKTFRSMRMYTDQWQVVEVDAVTGKTGKVLLKSEADNSKWNYPYGLSPDGKRFAVCSNDVMKVTVYDVDRGVKLSEHTFSGEAKGYPGAYFGLVFSRDGRRLVATRGRGRIAVVNADSGAALPPLEKIEMAGAILSRQAFSSDGRLLVLSGNGQLESPNHPFLIVWDTQTGKVLKSWDVAASVAFSPTRPVLAIIEKNGDSKTRVGFWDFAAEAAKK